MIDQAWAEAFAQEWIEGWNSTTLTRFWRTKAAPSLLFLGRHTTQRGCIYGLSTTDKLFAPSSRPKRIHKSMAITSCTAIDGTVISINWPALLVRGSFPSTRS